MDWLNACHIDTPVVSPVGPQTHNGSGSAGLYVAPLYTLSAATSVTCWLFNVDDFLSWFHDLFRGLVVLCCWNNWGHSISYTATLFPCTICWFFLPWMGGFSCDSLVIALPVLPVMGPRVECCPYLLFIAVCLQSCCHGTAIKRVKIAVYSRFNRWAELITQNCLLWGIVNDMWATCSLIHAWNKSCMRAIFYHNAVRWPLLLLHALDTHLTY